MDPVSNVDRLVLLLRQRLAERSASASGRGPATARRANPRAAIRELAAVDGADERPLRRALIQKLISESLGERLVNEAQFQQVVDRVTSAIEADPEAAKLLQRVVRELKAEARQA